VSILYASVEMPKVYRAQGMLFAINKFFNDIEEIVNSVRKENENGR